MAGTLGKHLKKSNSEPFFIFHKPILEQIIILWSENTKFGMPKDKGSSLHPRLDDHTGHERMRTRFINYA